MSQLLDALLSDPRMLSAGAITDVRIRVAENMDPQFEVVAGEIRSDLAKHDLGTFMDYVVVAIDTKGSDVTIQILAGPNDPIECVVCLFEATF